MYNYLIKIALVSETQISELYQMLFYFMGKGKCILKFSRLPSMHYVHC